MGVSAVVVFLFAVNIAICQETAQTVVASHLRECYSSGDLLNRNNLPPSTLPVFLDILRKIEDYPGTVAGMRQLSAGILHMFRQDGIVFDPASSTNSHVLPYSPTGFHSYKNRLLLSKLLPDNQFRFPNASLNLYEMCTLHHMLSSTIALESRGDESRVCPQLSQAGSRTRRSSRRLSTDVEVFDVNGAVDPLGRQIIGRSTCPLEYGVISTGWGAVSLGPLIAGIASALEPQQVLVSDLVRVKEDLAIEPTTRVNNYHSSTIAGDLAEAAMRQGTIGQTTTIGAAGFWNSTQARRHYFLSRTENLEITDAEIRGGIDGLILGDLGSSYGSDYFSELKLSQLIEMYYSEKGTMHDSRFRACSRRTLVTSVAPTETLRRETFAFAVALYTNMPLVSTLTLDGINKFVNNTVDSFSSYVASSINDPACLQNSEETLRKRLNLIIVASPTVAMYPMISYLLEAIDVSTHGSSVTMMDPQSGNTIIQKTHSLSQFHQDFARVAVSFQAGPSINLTGVLQSVRSMASADVVIESAAHYTGGNSTAVLFLVDHIPITVEETQDCIYLAHLMRQHLPDLRLIFATSSSARDTLEYIVQDSQDFIPLAVSAVSASAAELAPVVARLRNIPRRVVNPLCSTHWMDLNSGTVSFVDYVDASGVNLYSVHPNYFFQSNPTRAISVQEASYGSVNVCWSRTNAFPRRNRTTTTVPADVTCQSVTSSSVVDISLASACDGYENIQECPPLYFTVSSATTGNQPQCTEFGCRLPNDLKYKVVSQQLGCFSRSSVLLTGNVLLILLSLLTFKVEM